MKKNIKKSKSLKLEFSQLRKTVSFKVASTALLVSFLAIISLVYFAHHKYPQKNAQISLEKTQLGISQELEKFLNKNAELVTQPGLVDAVASENLDEISKYLSFAIDERGAPLVAVANKNGVVLGRSKNNNKIGDNFFLNNALGRKMIQTGEGVVAVEISTIDARLPVLASGQFIYKDGEKVGALFFGYAADETYAKYFAKTYLPAGVELAFYTKDFGLSGSSVKRQVGRDLLAQFLRPELDILQTNFASRFALLPGLRLFILQNLWLPGSEESPSGAVIFTPLPYVYIVTVLSALVPLALFFIILYLIHRHLKRKEKNSWLSSPLTIVFVVVYFVSCLAFVFAFYNRFIEFKVRPFPLYNSILRFQPEGGVFDRRFAQRMSVMLDSGGEAINAIRLSLSYNPEELKIQSVDMDRSICQNFIISEHNSETGKISMECIIPNPGFKGNSAVVTDLYLKPQDGVEQSSLHFLEDSQVLANDGLATNVLRMMVDSTLRFDSSDLLDTQQSIVVFSPTHPNPERWYSKRSVALSWAPTLPASITAVAQSHTASPLALPPMFKTVTQDGVHTFTLEAQNKNGQLISKSITARVDSTPPEKLELKASETRVKPGGLVRFTATGSDSMSGLQRVFYLKINDEIFFPIGSEIYIPFPQSGNYTITLRAYDKAGNHRDVSKKIIVKRYQ